MTDIPYGLRAEHLDEALGIRVTRPRLSWKLPSGAGAQRAYRISADSSWDTGRVADDQTVLVPYAGPPLSSGQRVTWRVKVWTDLGESGWSAPCWFEMGLLEAEDWQAEWIEPAGAGAGRPAPLLRYEFTVDRPIATARLHVTAHGLYEGFLNGARIGDAELTPGFTQYDARLQVQTYGSAGWGDAVIVVPWELYRAYGDTRILAEMWPAMVRWLDRAERIARTERHPSRAGRRPEAAPHEPYLWDAGFHWGEWLVPGEDPTDLDAFVAADKGDVATAYFARSARLMAAIAGVLGRDGHADRYAELTGRVREAWCAEYVGADGRLTPDTQANHVRALAFGLVPRQMRPAVAQRLVDLIRAADTHLGTGFLATPMLLPTRADTGHLDVAYELLFSDTEPSWLTMIDRGATTVWERWNGVDADGVPHESLNHYSKGAVVSYLHRYVAGIELLDDAPAYRRFRIRPRPGGGLRWPRRRTSRRMARSPCRGASTARRSRCGWTSRRAHRLRWCSPTAAPGTPAPAPTRSAPPPPPFDRSPHPIPPAILELWLAQNDPRRT